MADVLKSGSALTLPLTEISTDQVLISVEVDGVVNWFDSNFIDVSGSSVTFPSNASNIRDANAFAVFVVRQFNGQIELSEIRVEVIIESSDLLRPLENSFGTWAEASLTARYMVNIAPFNLSDPDQQKAALIQAYHNIGDLQVDFCPPKRRARYLPQNRMWDESGIFESELDRVHSTRMLTEEIWEKIHPDQKEKLIRAQVVEANFLLSGLTPEKQRLSGLLSHSAGESAHFYRTTKPLELPVCRATALALKGIISYVTRIGG